VFFGALKNLWWQTHFATFATSHSCRRNSQKETRGRRADARDPGVGGETSEALARHWET
jgi:hypothetical protein